MKKYSEDQFFSEYPMLSNLDELKKADILIMPENRQSFAPSQWGFKDLSSEHDINCLFFSEDQKKLGIYIENVAPVDFVILLGTVICTAAALLQLYEYIKNKMQGDKFRITNVIKINDSYYEMNEFEGNINDYKVVIQEIRSQFKQNLKK